MIEEELLQLIAVRPFELEPRLVYADWLAERGDPRAEVIALSARENLTMAERRRVAGIVADHSRRWLGPLEPIADPGGSFFVAGFLDTLTLAFNTRPADLLAVRDDPRLATVRALEAGAIRRPEALAHFLRQPMLASVKRLVLAPSALAVLDGAPVPFTLEALGVADAGLFHEVLRPLEHLPLAHTVPRWELISQLLFASAHAHETYQTLRPQLPICAVPELRLVVPYGVFEGVATWLTLPSSEGSRLTDAWRLGERWSVRAPGMLFVLHRGLRDDWGTMDVLIEADAMRELDDRLSRLASVLVLLGGARLSTITIELPSGLTVTRAHRYALKAACKRLRGTTVTLGSEPLSP